MVLTIWSHRSSAGASGRVRAASCTMRSCHCCRWPWNASFLGGCEVTRPLLAWGHLQHHLLSCFKYATLRLMVSRVCSFFSWVIWWSFMIFKMGRFSAFSCGKTDTRRGGFSARERGSSRRFLENRNVQMYFWVDLLVDGFLTCVLFFSPFKELLFSDMFQSKLNKPPTSDVKQPVASLLFNSRGCLPGCGAELQYGLMVYWRSGARCLERKGVAVG